MNLIDTTVVCVCMMKAFGLINAPWWIIVILMISPVMKFLCDSGK